LNITPPPAELPLDFYVYEHRKATTGEVFYVGTGKGCRAWFTANRKRHWVNIARKHGVVVRIVQDGLQEWFAHELERDLIALHGRFDAGKGSLVNVTDGGEGTSGRVLSAESRAKIASAKAGKRPHENTLAAISRPETRAKMSKAKRGKPASEAAKVARKIAMNRPDVKEKLRLAQLGRVTPAQLAASNARMVLCIETGSVFSSSGAAKRWLQNNGYPNANGAHVWSCCNGGRISAYGYTWRYA
jgi:hypothetical protein